MPAYDVTPDEELAARRLSRLLVPGQLRDRDLERRCERLHDRFRIFAGRVRTGLWAPGLVISDEMRRECEAYLPLKEIRRSFERFRSRAVRINPEEIPSLPDDVATWPDCCERLGLCRRFADPGLLLQTLMEDPVARMEHLFAVSLPKRHGNAFGRYPDLFLPVRSWLRHRASVQERPLRCLDAASGTGEGLFDLAMFLVEEGIDPRTTVLTGSSLGPLEIFAAAHGHFPGDPDRARRHRSVIDRCLGDGWGGRIRFRVEDLRYPMEPEKGRYDLILCNGLLGGPMMHDAEEIRRAVRLLAGRLAKGGILLCENRFHGGWKKRIPDGFLRECLGWNGLEIVAGDCVAGVKKSPEGL